MPPHARRRFEPTPEAIREARQFLREVLADRIAEPITEDLALALSELATNAVRHAETPFEVVVDGDEHLRVEVEDASPTPPEPRDLSSTAVGGRGLQILDHVCDRWGVHVLDDRKCVWCERDLTEE